MVQTGSPCSNRPSGITRRTLTYTRPWAAYRFATTARAVSTGRVRRRPARSRRSSRLAYRCWSARAGSTARSRRVRWRGSRRSPTARRSRSDTGATAARPSQTRCTRRGRWTVTYSAPTERTGDWWSLTRCVRARRTASGARHVRFGTLGSERMADRGLLAPDGLAARRWHLGPAGALTADPGEAETIQVAVDPTASSGGTNRWLAIDQGQGAAYPDGEAADEPLTTFTTTPLPARRPRTRVSRRDPAPGHLGDRRCGLRLPRGRQPRWCGDVRDRGMPAVCASAYARSGRTDPARRAADLRPCRRPERRTG